MNLAIVFLVSNCVLSSYGFTLFRNPFETNKNDFNIKNVADRFTNSFSPSWNMGSGNPWSISLVLGKGRNSNIYL